MAEELQSVCHKQAGVLHQEHLHHEMEKGQGLRCESQEGAKVGSS